MRQERRHRREHLKWPCSVYKRLDHQIAAYKSERKRQRAYYPESARPPEYQQKYTGCYPAVASLSEKGYRFHYRRKPIGIQRTLDADQ